MQAQIYWVLIVFGIQLIKKKCSVRPVFPDYLLLLMTMIYQNLGTNFCAPKNGYRSQKWPVFSPVSFYNIISPSKSPLKSFVISL